MPDTVHSSREFLNTPKQSLPSLCMRARTISPWHEHRQFIPHETSNDASLLLEFSLLPSTAAIATAVAIAATVAPLFRGSAGGHANGEWRRERQAGSGGSQRRSLFFSPLEMEENFLHVRTTVQLPIIFLLATKNVLVHFWCKKKDQ